MREILGKPNTVHELLKGLKYSIDYYERGELYRQIVGRIRDSDKLLKEIGQ